MRLYRPQVVDFWLKMLVYGEYGVGKTTLCASADVVPEMEPVLFCNVEGVILSLTDPTVWGATKPPEVTDFTKFEDLEVLFDVLRTEEHGFRTLAIDSLSELQTQNIDQVTEKKGRPEDVIFLEDYGTSAKQLRRVIRKFRDLPMHVLLTCHAGPQDKSPDPLIGPMLTPALRKSVLGFMDVVGYMYMDGDGDSAVRKMLTRPWGKWIAKDRSPGQKLGTIVEEPSMQKIMDLINGRITAPSPVKAEN